jgi:Mrp family chromosome partitioning ATPase
MAAQLAGYVLEPVEETVEVEPVELQPCPVIAVVSAAPRSGATTVARLLAAELAARGDGVAVVTSTGAPSRRGGPPARAAVRLATALRASADVRAVGRLCIARPTDHDALVNAARYLAPVVLDLPPDGSAAGAVHIADAVAVVAAGSGEPALAAAVALVLGGEPVKVANRIVDPGGWQGRADVLIPDSRIAARAAPLGTRPLGPLGAAIAELADALEADS